MDTIKKKRFNAIAFTLVIVAALLVGVTPTPSALVLVDRDVTTGSVLARFVVSGYLIDK